MKIKIPNNLNIEEEIVTDNSGENVIQENEEEDTKKSSKVDINKANESELQTLPGIGKELATRIIEYREEKGEFSKIEEIKNVSGIGESKFDKIKDMITVK